MTRYVVFVAMLAAIVVIRRRGLQAAFLDVWIPFFLVLPFGFWVDIPGLPAPNFMQAATLPILFVLFRDRLAQMRFGAMEALLLLYVAVRVFADFLGRGYSDAQNYAFYMLSALVGSYLIGRYVIDSRRMDIDTSRRFVLMFLLFFPLFVYEAKFWVSPIYQLVSPLFPGSGSGLSLRWGFARTAGTFEHPILACVMIVAVYRLHRWLHWIGEWGRPQPGLMGTLQRLSARIPIAFSHQISIVLIVMAVMTISRGPWIGAFAGATVAAVGNFTNRKRWLAIVVAAFLVGGIGGQLALDAYITPKEGEVLSGEAQTMLYRKVMIDQYKEFLLEKLWTGWGLTTVPKIRGMESVDNAFFLMALQHGLPAVIVFGTILASAIVSQIRFGLQAPKGESPVGFTFAGIYVMCVISFLTVYMGSQTEPLLFLLLGWGESVRQRGLEPAQEKGAPARAGPARPFRRVMT
jgi:hypothetical protein